MRSDGNNVNDDTRDNCHIIKKIKMRSEKLRKLLEGVQLQREVKYLYNKMASYKPKVC